jgi:ABC-type spermidine/putrescine transport system permease subunit I
MLVGGVNTTTLGTLIYSFFITVRGEAGWGIGSAAGLIYIIFIMVLSYLYIKLVGAEVQFG